MAKETRAIFEQAIAQLEAKKQSIFNNAKSTKENELEAEYKQFETERRTQYEAAVSARRSQYEQEVAALRTSFEATIAAKKAEISTVASSYATERAKSIDEEIAVLKGMIEDDEGEV